MFYRQSVLSFLAVLSMTLVSLCLAEEKPLRLVAMFHLTGDWAMEGKAFQEGAEIAAQELNDQGGVKGRKVELVFEDTAYVAKQSLTIAKKIISDSSVDGVLITTLHETKASGPILERAGIPTIVLWDSAPQLEQMGECIFSIGPWAPDTGRKAADFAFASLKAHSAFVLTTNHDWSSSVGKAFTETFHSAGGKVLESMSVNPEDSDFRSLISRLVQVNPAVVYAPLVDHIIPFIRQLRSANFIKPVIMSDNITEVLLDQAAKELEGVYQTMVADPAGPETTHFRELYLKHFKSEPKLTLFSTWAYDAVRMFAWAADQGAKTREQIKTQLYKLKDFPGASGSLSMNERGSAPKFVSMFRVEAGKLKLIEGPGSSK